MILPAFGVISHIVSTFSRKPIFGYLGMAYAMVAIGGVGEGDHAVAARLVLGPVVPLVLQGEGAGVLEGDAVAVAESVGGIPVAERGVVTDDPDVGGGALQLELDANVRGDFHGPSAPAWGLHMGVP